MRTGSSVATSRRASLHRLGLVLCITLVAWSGCTRVRVPVPKILRASEEPGYTAADLSSDLAFFADRYASAVITAADRIAYKTEDRSIKRATVMWKLRLLPMMQELAFLDDPQQAFANVLALAFASRKFVEVGDGSELFGEFQYIAIETASELEEEILAIGRRFISQRRLDLIIAEMEEIAETNSVSGADFNTQRVQRAVARLGEQGALGAVLNAPLAPFRAFDGVSEGAAAIRDFNRTAEEFAQIVSYLPRQLRWETQLLLYDIEDRETVLGVRASMRTAAESAERMAAAAEGLPDDMRAILGQTEPALAAANAVLETVRTLLGPLQTTAEQLRAASGSWEAILTSDDEPDPDARPFDVREWEQTFTVLGTAAGEIRDLTNELQSTVEDQYLANALAQLNATVDDAEARARGVVDLAAWRALQLLIVFFVLLGAYRLLTRSRTG